MPTEKTAQKLLEAPKPYDFGFTLGADPEFTMMSGNRPMNCRSTMKAFIKDATEIPDSHGGGFIFEPFGNIGWDGHPATGELRPNPAARPEGIVANIRGLFTEVAKRIPFVEYATLTVAQPTGGHIHLSVPQELNGLVENKTPKWFAIERALATFLLLIMVGENSLSRELRRRSNGGKYGSLLDFRTEAKFRHPNGAPGYTIEVRGPTAEWLTTEKIALGTFAYLAIAWDYILKGDLKPIAEILLENKRQAEAVLPTMLSNFGGAQRLYLNQMRPFIRKHPAYREYKEALELVLNPQRAISTKKLAHFSITEGWGIGKKSSQIPTKDFLKDDEIESKTADFPESVIRNVSAFAWNDDLNVEAFATALGKRCVALGWKPEHEYFLFGLKKGLPHIILRDEKGRFVAGKETMETKEDLRIMANKFKRLAPRAEPVYGNFLNHRTGEPTRDDTSMRVMIGIPYAMRQKMDYKPLIKLVLKFEKDPKAFSALEESSLPEGASKIKAALQAEERTEQQLEEAFSGADHAMELHPDDVRAFEEARATEGLVSGEAPSAPNTLVLSSTSLDTITRVIASLVAAIPLGTGNTRDSLRMATSRSSWPIINSGMEEVLNDLAHVIESYPLEEMARQLEPKTAAYLLCKSINQRGVSSIGREWNNFVVFDHGVFIFGTMDVNQAQAGEMQSAGIFLDLIGVSDSSVRDTIIETLERNPQQRFSISLDRGVIAGDASIVGTALRINPDNALPHVWSD